MKVLFVWPNQGDFSCKPIGISLLSSILEDAGHETDLFDTTFMDLGGTNYNEELTKNGFFKPVNWGCDVSKKKVDLKTELFKKLEQFDPDVVAISVLSDEINTANQIISFTREFPTSIKIIVGNKGALLGNDFFEEIDAYFEGEAIGSLLKYLKNLEINDRTFWYYHQPYCKDLDSLPYLDWSIYDDRHFLKAFDGKVYRGGDHMIGWGCINSCSYCINEHWREIHGGMKGSIRMYSVDRIIEELSILSIMHHIDFWKFHDEDILLKPIKYLRHLAQEYATKIDLPFTCMTNARNVTEEKAEILKGMGCASVSIGIESGNQIIRQVLRRRETTEDIVNGARLLDDEGIRVSAFNMIGLPFETEETILETIKLNREAGIKHPNVSFYMPLEGTKLHDLSVKYGFYNPSVQTELRTDRPNLKLPGISNEKLMYYYENFHRLVTGE